MVDSHMAGHDFSADVNMLLDSELDGQRGLITDFPDTEKQTFRDKLEDNPAEPMLWMEDDFATAGLEEPAEHLDEAEQDPEGKADATAADFDADEEDADEYDHELPAYGYNKGYSGSATRNAGGRLGGGRADSLLDFIDEVSDGINSYLGYLEERNRGVVYDRHDRAECERWRDLLRSMHLAANEAWEERRSQPKAPQQASYAQCPMEDWSAELRPCRPPQDVQFEAPPPLPHDTGNGRRRLAFSACFECGNLALAKSDSPTSYILFLDFDVNTSGYTQWFYFGVRGGHQGLRVTFRIVNMSKAESLFCSDRGMRPVVWSEKAGRAWERGCSDVSYYPNEHRREVRASGEHSSVYYTLEFTYTFEFDDDTVFFAYHYPYSYTHLQDFIAWLVAHPYISRFLRKDILCRTIGGLVCDILQIGEDEPSKPLAVVTARVHPGESNSSWMVQGLLQFLCSPAPEAQALRDACTWLVVPMLNPDGVVQGNYRCGLAGADLNRTFQNPHRKLHPTVWHLKERLRGRRIDVYLDLHGHSKREGIFLYGGTHPDEDRTAQVRLLPKLCSIASTDFKYYQCVFSIQDSKMTTARLVAFLQFGILHAYTVEASFSSPGTTREEEGSHDFAPEGHNNAGRPPLLPGGSATQTEARAKLARAYATQARPPGLIRRINSVESLTPSEGSDDEGLQRYCRTWSEIENSQSIMTDDTLPRQVSPPARPEQYTNPTVDLASETLERLKAARGEFPVEVSEGCPSIASGKENFDPSRLEMAGPTLLKSLFSTWQLTKGLTKPSARNRFEVEDQAYMKWNHLHFDRLTPKNVLQEYHSLLQKGNKDTNDKYSQAVAKLGYLGEDPGSDSNPSDDEKSAAELHAIHRRILAKLRRRRIEPEEKPKQIEEPEVQYKTVIAFGKTLKLPIVNGRMQVPVHAGSVAGARHDFAGRKNPSAAPTDGVEPRGGRPRSAPSGPPRVSLEKVSGTASIIDAPERLIGKGAAEGDSDTRPEGRHRAASFDNDAHGRKSSSLPRHGPHAGQSLAVAEIGKPDENAEHDRVNVFLAKMCAYRQAPHVQLENYEDSVVRRRSDDGYGPSDVRSFVEVRSIKPQKSSSRRAAAQLRKPLTGDPNAWRDWAQQRPAAAPPAPGIAFALPPASAAHTGQRRNGPQALQRVVIEREKPTATAPFQSPSPIIVTSSDSRQTATRGRQLHAGGTVASGVPDVTTSSGSVNQKPQVNQQWQPATTSGTGDRSGEQRATSSGNQKPQGHQQWQPVTTSDVAGYTSGEHRATSSGNKKPLGHQQWQPAASSSAGGTSGEHRVTSSGNKKPPPPPDLHDSSKSLSLSRRKSNHATVNVHIPSGPVQQHVRCSSPAAALDAASSEASPQAVARAGHGVEERGMLRRPSAASGGSASDAESLDIGHLRLSSSPTRAGASSEAFAMVGVVDEARAGSTALDEETASASNQFERGASGSSSTCRSFRTSIEELDVASWKETKRQLKEMVHAPDVSSCSLTAAAQEGLGKRHEADLPPSPAEQQPPRRPLSANLAQAGWHQLRRQDCQDPLKVEDGWTDDGADVAASSAQDTPGAAEVSIPLSSMLASSGLRPKPSIWMEPARNVSPMLTLPRTLLGTGNSTSQATGVASTATKAAGATRPTTPSASTSIGGKGPTVSLCLQPQAASQAAVAGSSVAGAPAAQTVASALKDGSIRRSPGLVGSGAGVMQGVSTNAASGTKQLLPPRSAGSQANSRSGRSAHRSGATSARGASAGKHTPRAPVYQHLLA